MKPPPETRQAGVALVTTVIVIAVLAVVAVAFMQSTGIDRLSSRVGMNYFRAKLAAEAGLAVAEATLARAMTNDTFIVVANADRQMFVGNGISKSINFSYTPIFSTVSNLSTAVSNIVTAAIPSTNVAGGILFTNALPGGLSITSPAVRWVYLTNASGQTNARFVYWVEDLGGKLDLSVVGATNDSDWTNARRLTGTNPAEIALWSLFNSNSPSDPDNAAATNLVGARSNLVTVATARLVEASVTTNNLAELAANLRHDTNEPELIPFGFRYADEGRAKYNLNTYTNVAGAARLADAIIRNLPNFGNRSGAMDPTAYVNSIAASIVDYADTNDVPTVDNPDNPTYFGIENIPWPNELFDQIEFRGVSGGAINFRIKDWVEVWNMGNKPISATTKLSLSNNYNLILTFTNTFLQVGFKTNVQSAKCIDTGQAGPEWLSYRTFSNTVIAPNGYAVLEVDKDSSTYLHRDFSVALTNPSWYATPPIRGAWAIYADSNDSSPNLTHVARWGGVVIQKTPDGRWPRYLSAGSSLKPPPAPSKWIFCNNLGYASQSGFGKPPNHSGGDPRAQYHLKGALYDQNYINKYASPGGRNVGRQFISTYPESEVNPRQYWPDSGHTGIPDNTSIDWGGDPTSYNNSPQSIASAVATNVAMASNNWVMLRNDTGSFSNILELGNIFDPMQWGDNEATPATNQPGLWENLTDSAAGDDRFGGRNTLRVGRWEFSRLTNAGTRASQLLDIFAVSTNPSGMVTNRVAGRINLNTAGPNALRALAAGVFLTSDAAALTASGVGTNSKVPAAAVDDFVKAVVATRAERPFYSTSELNMIGTDTIVANWPTNSVFGNRTRQFITAANDAFHEEWFARVYPLSAVRSRNFLVHVVGQVVQTNNPTGVLSTARRVFQIYMAPVRGPSGLTTNNSPRILATWDL